jgi:cytoskeleton protein RodZ
MKADQYVDIGQYLRDSRESLRITIEHAAHSLHIRPKYLQAIETGNLEDLPGKAYIRGYIKNYAEYLRLDSQEVLEAYEALLENKDHDFFIPEPTLRQNLPTRKIVLWSLFCLLGLYSYWYFGVHEKPPVSITVAEIPPKFMLLLDKTPKAGMDTAWKQCLDMADLRCFVDLHARDTIPKTVGIYDIIIQYNTPQKP